MTRFSFGPALRNRRGTVLIVVLGVLVVLSLLGVSFAKLSTLDHTIASSFLDGVRAQLLARSGVERAVDVLRFDPFSDHLAYRGNDETGKAGEASVRGVPLEWASHPSLREAQNSILDIRNVDGTVRKVGISGRPAGGRYTDGGDVYQLKISDLSGRIYLNDGVTLYGGNESSVSQNLKRILNVLGGLETVNIAELGDRVLKHRPAAGFTHVQQLRSFLSPEEVRRVEPLVTIFAWVDKNVANPVPLSAGMADKYPVKYYRGSPPVYRRGRGANSKGQKISGELGWFDSTTTSNDNSIVYGLDELNPSYIEMVHRAPVNVNAAPREVLIALLAQVQGFFISERRTFTPYNPSPDEENGGYYGWWKVTHSYDPSGEDADAYGYLYSTMPLAIPEKGTTSERVNAGTIADHMIACRDRALFDGLNYATLDFGGPFKTWSQFNRFIDSLVEHSILVDTRNIFYDYPGKDNSWSGLTAAPSEAGRKFASYALADALKANFNPNLHLNETNPDANLFLRVDKTDLIVNSTEFTFLPTGYFDIESVGRVLSRPQQTGGGTQVQGDGTCAALEIVAEAKVEAMVKAFDVYRETSQRHFLAGKISPKNGAQPTNSGTALERGPEPGSHHLPDGDHFGGYAIRMTPEQDGYLGYRQGQQESETGWGYEYDGYLQLSTYGGAGSGEPKFNASGGTTHWPTDDIRIAASKGYLSQQEGMHAHFQEDFNLHHNRAHGITTDDECASKDIGASNYPDPGEVAGGPYPPLSGGALKYRLSRSFRLPLNTISPSLAQAVTGTTSSLPNFPAVAPTDLRLDGMYSERNGAPAYQLKQGGFEVNSGSGSVDERWNFVMHGGALNFWVKPSFFPEHTGKIRSLFSMAKYHEKGKYRNPAPFSMFFFPGHDKAAYEQPAVCEMAKWMNNAGLPAGGEYGGYIARPSLFSPTAHGCEYRNPFSPMYDGNIPEAGMGRQVEKRGIEAKGVWQIRPTSLMFVRAATTADAGMMNGSNVIGIADLVDVENYAVTSSLNHNLHTHGLDTGSVPRTSATPGTAGGMRFEDEQGGEELHPWPNYLEAHRWTHVQCSWMMVPPF